MILRDYQSRAIQQLYEWFQAGNEGNPCLVLPTGSGKSHIVAQGYVAVDMDLEGGVVRGHGLYSQKWLAVTSPGAPNRT